MWYAINRGSTALFDLLLWPVAALGSLWQLAWLALFAACLALLVFRATSDQDAIERAKDRVKARLLELWIYRDDLVVILLDMTMSGVDGPALLARMRDAGVQTPVILTSGYDQETLAPRLAQAADAGFLHKPFSAEDLKLALQECIDPV